MTSTTTITLLKRTLVDTCSRRKRESLKLLGQISATLALQRRCQQILSRSRSLAHADTAERTLMICTTSGARFVVIVTSKLVSTVINGALAIDNGSALIKIA